jgi:hypothetical protein
VHRFLHIVLTATVDLISLWSNVTINTIWRSTLCVCLINPLVASVAASLLHSSACWRTRQATMLRALGVAAAVASSLLATSSAATFSVPDASRVQELKQPPKRVAFGSCNDQSFPQPMWPNIAAHEPELWVWMGDNVRAVTVELSLVVRFKMSDCQMYHSGQIYADVKELGEPRPFPFPPRKRFVEAPPAELIRRYKYVWWPNGASGRASCGLKD